MFISARHLGFFISVAVATILSMSMNFWPHQENGPSQTTITVLDSSFVDSVVADFPVGFDFINGDGWQFVAYYDKGRTLKVASRQIPSSTWTYRELPSRVGWDSHNRIVMAKDRAGNIHISANMHNDTMTYFMTRKPNDISTFSRVFPLVNESDELRCTYPKFFRNASGELIFSYRNGGSGNGVTILNVFDEMLGSYRRLTDEPLFDGLGLMSAYARGPILGPDGYFHLIWFWRDTPGCETNHDLSYTRSKDLVRWESINGRKIFLPITPEVVHTTVDPVPPRGGAINGGAQLFFGPENQPMIAYMKYDSAGHSQIFLATSTGEAWNSRQISRWDYRWNFSGPGSIDFEIRLKPHVHTDESRIHIPYEHIKYGSGELVIDAASLNLIEDRSTHPIEQTYVPQALLQPRSGIDSVEVRWLFSEGGRSAASYHALRWETMTTRRFYRPRKKPVKPSSLILYLLGGDDQ